MFINAERQSEEHSCDNELGSQGQQSFSASEQATGRENAIYTRRFSAGQDLVRQITWEVLCREFLQDWISPNDVVADVGAGDGLFLRNIRARRRIAVDLSAHVLELQKFGIEVLNIPATELAEALDEPADVIFMSNFLEHMPSKRIMLDVLEGARRALKPNGKIMVLQPNVRYAGAAYWDYVDHHIALTEHSLAEGLEISGFKVEKLIPQFLPYTVKSSTGKFVTAANAESIVSWYLKLPLLWRIFGAQTFVVARAS